MEQKLNFQSLMLVRITTGNNEAKKYFFFLFSTFSKANHNS